MLFRPEAFERLTDEPWNATCVHERVQAIADAADDAFDPEALWPTHEDDLWDALAPPAKSLFVGAAGVVLTAAAVIEESAANWPPTSDGDMVGRDGQIRLRWCQRHSLFSGALSPALFAADCITGAATFPALDGFDSRGH
jgi:hypothetical protein